MNSRILYLPETAKTHAGKAQLFSGRRFLRMYWSGELKAMGCAGVYDKEYLKKTGGVECFSDSAHPLYSEHILLVRAGLFKQVVHIDQPLVRYRLHDSAWGCITSDLSLYKQAGTKLISKSINILRSPELAPDFRPNMNALLKFVVTDFFAKARASEGFLSRLEVLPFFFSLKKQSYPLKKSTLYRDFLFVWASVGMRLAWWILVKFNLKAALLHALGKLKQAFRQYRSSTVERANER